MTPDILHGDPLVLLEAPLSELFVAVKSIDDWTERHAEALDDAYRGRVAQLLTRRGSTEELLELHQHLTRASGLVRAKEGLADRWAERWNSYAAVLSARIGALHSQNPEAVCRRAHVKDVLDVVRDAGTTGIAQSAIGKKLDLQKANLARILSLMEANDLIERRPSETSRREKQVFLGRNARGEKHPPSQDSDAPSPDDDARNPGRRGMQYLAAS